MSKERWDVHEHKDELFISDENTICHPTKGQLCRFSLNQQCVISVPVVFRTKALAQKWIENGCIADVQEEFQSLSVGFRNKLVDLRDNLFSRNMERKAETNEVSI